MVYDPAKVSYQKLLDAFWHNVDPITPNAQFCDHGSQYRSAIFFQTDEEKRASETSKQAIEQSKRFTEPIVTQIVPASQFYPAEEYHQDFYKRILSATNSTNTIVVARSGWKRCGETPRRKPSCISYLSELLQESRDKPPPSGVYS